VSRALVGPVAALALVLLPGLAGAQSQVEGELNRAKAAMQLKKYDEAAARFEKLARAGNPAAQFYMGRLTAMGLGVAQDLPKAVDWFQLAATQGHVEAQAVLGFHYMEGVGVAPSYAEAARWSARAGRPAERSRQSLQPPACTTTASA
jgi:TPR repeat protein